MRIKKFSWLIVTITILILGISFRLAHLGDKIFWIDEVATITRVSGYTRSQIIAETKEQDIIYASDLLRYQRLNSDKTFSDTIDALVQSPEHAPFYFILTRFWLQLFGNSIVAIRSLSVIFGLLCLPSIYYLSQELFESQTASWMSLLLLSVSPFYVAYSQEARPYSLWTLLILTTSNLLLKALKKNRNTYWYGYLLTTIISIYTSLLSWLVLLSHGCYLIILKNKNKYALKNYSIIVIASLITFLPWLWVIVNHWYQLQDNTSWMDEPMKIGEMTTVWVASILLIFGNLPLSPELDLVGVVGILILSIVLLLMILSLYSLTRKSYIINYKILAGIGVINIIFLFGSLKVFTKNLPLQVILNPTPLIVITTAFGLLFLVLYSLIFVSNKAPQRIKYFLISLFLVPTATLIISDFIFQDQRLARPRYIIPAQLAIILIITYLLSYKINNASKIARLTFNLVLILGVVSCSLTWQDSPQFQKSRNSHNPAIEKIINQTTNPLVISDSEQILDLLSLSHNLEPQVAIKLFTSIDEISPEYFSDLKNIKPKQNIFLFNPNSTFLQSIEAQKDLIITEIYKPHLRIPWEIYLSLWSIQRSVPKTLDSAFAEVISIPPQRTCRPKSKPSSQEC